MRTVNRMQKILHQRESVTQSSRRDIPTDRHSLTIATSNARSSLRLLLFRHPAKPIQRTRRGDVEADVNPQQPEISPPGVKADTDRVQELSSILHRTVLAKIRGRRIQNVTACGADV
jgi:hypothetical protein